MIKNQRTVLIWEEEPDVSRCLEMAIRSSDCAVQVVRDRDEVLTSLQSPEIDFSALFLGLVTLDRTDLDLLREIRALDSKLPVVVAASSWSAREVIVALRNGVTDFLCRPIVQEELTSVLTRAFEAAGSKSRSESRNDGVLRTFKSANARISAIEARSGKIGWSGAPVLIQGKQEAGRKYSPGDCTCSRRGPTSRS